MANSLAPNIVAAYDFPTTAGLTAVNATLANDTDNYKTGVQGVKVTKTSALGSIAGVECRSIFPAFTFTPAHEIKVRLFVPDATVIANMQIFLCRGGATLSADDGRAAASWNLNAGQPIPGGWQEFFLKLRPHALYSHAAGGVANVTGLAFYIYQECPAGDWFTLDDAKVAVRTSSQKAVFIHTADDGFRDQQYKHLRAILNKNRIRTALAVIPRYVGVGNDVSGYATAPQLRELAADGHELVNHSADGHDLPSAYNGKSQAQRMALLSAGLAWMVANGMSRHAGGFTVPLGLGNGCEWTDEQIAEQYKYCTTILDTSPRGWPVVPRPVCRVRCDNTLRVGTLTRGATVREVVGGSPTGVTATFSHYGQASGANTYIYLRLNSTGVPAGGSGAVWTDGTNSDTTNAAVESSSYGLGRTAQPVAPGTNIDGFFPNLPAALWYAGIVYRCLADWGPVATSGTQCIKTDTIPDTTTFTWNNGTKQLTANTGTPLAGLTWAAGDLAAVVEGTGWTPGFYSLSGISGGTTLTLDGDAYVVDGSGNKVAPNIAGSADVKVLTIINGGANYMRAVTRGAIAIAIARNAFCPLLHHRVLADSGVYDNTHGKVADVNNALTYLRSRVDAGAAAIMSLGEAMAEAGIDLAPPPRRGRRRIVGRG